jgi:hypothetical protein
MGVSASGIKIVNSEGKEVIPTPAKNAQWVYSPTTGYKWVIPGIRSGPEVKKVTNPDGSQTWGPYKKTYTKSEITGLPVFTPPETIDGIRPLCRCRMIRQYMDPGGQGKGNLAADLALVSGTAACWDDTSGFTGPSPDTYSLTINHPFFELYSAGGQGLLGSAARLRGFAGPLPPPGQSGALNMAGRPVLYGQQQPRRPSTVMINPMTGQQTALYGPTYTTTTKILGGRILKKGRSSKNSKKNRSKTTMKRLAQRL